MYSRLKKDISKYINCEVKDHPRDNKQNFNAAITVLKRNQVILLIVSLLIVVIMLPETIDVIKNTCQVLFDSNVKGKYDILSVTLILINTTFVGFLIIEVISTVKLTRKIIKLNPERTK